MEAYTNAVEKFCASKRSSQGTIKQYRECVERLFSALGEKLTDPDVVINHVSKLKPATQQKYAWAVAAALRGLEKPLDVITVFENEARRLSRIADSPTEQKRKRKAASTKLKKLPDYKPFFQSMIEDAERKIAIGTHTVDSKSGHSFQRKYTPQTLETYRRFVIFCKICLNSAPGRSDLCTVFVSKAHADAAGGKNYYENGTIYYGVRVKDEAGIKPNPPIDVSGAKADIDAFIKHGSPYILGWKYTSAAFSRWVIAMSENFCGDPVGICLIRKLYVNQKEKKAARAQTKKDAKEMGHSEATRSKHYDLDSEDEDEEVLGDEESDGDKADAESENIESESDVSDEAESESDNPEEEESETESDEEESESDEEESESDESNEPKRQKPDENESDDESGWSVNEEDE